MENKNKVVEELKKKFLFGAFTEIELKTMIGKQMKDSGLIFEKQEVDKIIGAINKSQSLAGKKVGTMLKKSLDQMPINMSEDALANISIPNIPDNNTIKANSQTKYGKEGEQMQTRAENKKINQSSETNVTSIIGGGKQVTSSIAKKIAIGSVCSILGITSFLGPTDEEEMKNLRKSTPFLEQTIDTYTREAGNQLGSGGK